MSDVTSKYGLSFGTQDNGAQEAKEPSRVSDKYGLGSLSKPDYIPVPANSPNEKERIAIGETGQVVEMPFGTARVLQGVKGSLGNLAKSTYLGLGPSFSESVYGGLEAGFGTIDQTLQALGSDPTFYGQLQDVMNGLREKERINRESIQSSMGEMGFIEKNINSGMQSVAQLMPAALLSALSGNPAPVLAVGGISSGGSAAGKGLDAGLSPAHALAYGAEDASVEILTERIPVLKLIGDVGVGAPLWRTLMNQITRELPGELSATTMQNFNEYANVNSDKPFASYLQTLPSDLADTAVATIFAVGAQTTAVHSVA